MQALQSYTKHCMHHWKKSWMDLALDLIETLILLPAMTSMKFLSGSVMLSLHYLEQFMSLFILIFGDLMKLTKEMPCNQLLVPKVFESLTMLVLLNNCQLGTLITGESLKALQQIGFKLTLSYVSLYLSESLSLCPFFYMCVIRNLKNSTGWL